MSENTDTTAPADDMAGDIQTTDEDQIWQELAAEEGAADTGDDPDEAANTEDAPDDDQDDEGAEGADDDPGDPDDGPDGEGDDGGEEDAPDDDAETPTLDELRKKSETLEQKFRSEQTRSIAQQKRADRLQKELEALKRRQATKDETDDDGREERLNAAAEEYPEVVTPLLEEVKSLRSRFSDLTDGDKQRLATIEGELGDIHDAEVAKFQEEHPDGMDVIAQNAEVFRDWIEDQPKFVRDAYQANLDNFVDGTGAALVVSRFKAALSEAAVGDESRADPKPETDTRLERRRRRQLDGAKSTRSTSTQKAAGDIPPDTDDEEAIWKYWAAKDAKG